MKKKPHTLPQAAEANAAPAGLVFGWSMAALFLALGIVLESFHLVKLPAYLDRHLRRELWTLAHAHGTLLGLVNVLFALSAGPLGLTGGQLVRAGRLLRLGSVLVPAGFFLGGVANAEGDPSPAILLVPVGAVLVLAGIAGLPRSKHRSRPG